MLWQGALPHLLTILMFKECSNGVETPNYGELKRRFLSLAKSQLYKLNSFSNFSSVQL